jgi:type IV conjugative transfer system protein TraL
MSEKSYYVPKHLDDPPKALWWDADEIIVFATILFPGILLKSFLLFLVFLGVAIFLTYQYTKIKSGKIRGFLIHLIYWSLGSLKFKRIPESHIREISG